MHNYSYQKKLNLIQMTSIYNAKVFALCSVVILSSFVMSYIVYVRKEMAKYESSKRPFLFLPRVSVTEEEERRRLVLQYNELSLNTTRRKRLPDVIGIGVEKCGSGPLNHFLRHHPLIKVKTTEVHFFDGFYHKGFNYYKEKLAEAADYELVMEKTPAYFNKPEVNIPSMIKSDVPDAKLIAILCDPVNRTFSDFIHERIIGLIPNDMRFEVFVDQYLMHFQGKPFEYMNDQSAESYIRVKDQNFHLSHLLSTGLYYYHLRNWYRYYNSSNLYLVDGEELLIDPGKVIDQIQDFLRLPKLLLQSDFQKPPGSNFFCVKSVLDTTNNTFNCLESYRKGRTRFGAIVPPEATMEKLRKFYKPHNEKLFKLIHRDFGWK